jgi:hypothetical protein
VESLHLRPRRKPHLDVIVDKATPLFVIDDLHEIPMLALQVCAAIQALDIVQNSRMAIGFHFEGHSNPEAAQASLGITVYATKQKDWVDHHLSLFLPKAGIQYTTHHKEAMKRSEFRSLSEGMAEKMSIRKAFIRHVPLPDL